LLLDEHDLDRLGPVAKCAPPLRTRHEVDALWQAVLEGAVDMIGSDHSPCPPEDKLRGSEDIWAAWGGISGVQTMVPVLLSEGVHRRGLTLERMVALVCGAPARRFGLSPRKGTLRVGSDADCMLVALDESWTLQEADLRQRWPSTNPFIGRQFRGRVRATLLRGEVAFQEGRVMAEPGRGQLLRPEGQL
jgi:allantoinase